MRQKADIIGKKPLNSILKDTLKVRTFGSKVLGIIAIVAVIGFSMVSCEGTEDGGGGDSFPKPKGKLTVTGIPSEYNGKFAYVIHFKVTDPDNNLVGGAKMVVKGSSIYYTPVAISGGKVEIPLYISKGELYGNKFEAYDGNGRIYASTSATDERIMYVCIVDKGSEFSPGYAGTTELASKAYRSGTFNNGNLTVQWE